MTTTELIDKFNDIKQQIENLTEKQKNLLKKVETELVKDELLKKLTPKEEEYFNKYFMIINDDEDVPF